MLIICYNEIFSQPEEMPSGKEIYFDAICFNSDSAQSARMDVFVMVPYSALYFVKSNELYGAKYEINIKILDQNNKKVKEEQKVFQLSEKDYFAANGGTGKFDISQTIFNLQPGVYEIEAVVTDLFSKSSYKKSRVITIIDFVKYPFSLSGIMLVSSIEENNGKFIITPHLSDNIGNLSDGFFAFFEFYAYQEIDTVDFVYQILKMNGDSVLNSEITTRKVNNGTSQHFLPITFPKKQPQGTYNLRITALNHKTGRFPSLFDTLAITERSIKYFRSVGGAIIADIDKSVKQLRYIATSDELDYIESAQTTDEKERRFEDFWLKKDPSPNTERNEAFDQYYSRIEYANKNFKSYSEGWRTDKGMVFIVYGKPVREEQTTPSSDGRVYEQWTYGNGKKFIFVDNSGFGDFRLSYPSAVTDKYVYSPGE
jgi:GWxTD domain-containing protein